MEWLTTVKQYFSKYWSILLGFSAVFAYLVFRKKPDSAALPVDIRNSGKKFGEDVDTARGEESAANAAEKDRHTKAMTEITEKYETIKSNLDEAEKAECERILKQKGKSPVALAEELAAVTGAKIIMPKD